MSELKIFLGGEGPDELGDFFYHPSYRTGRLGLIEALLHRVRSDGWRIEGGLIWKKIRKYRAQDHRSPERRNVLGLALAAREAGCHVICFARDRDRDTRREEDIGAGIEDAQATFSDLRVIGGVAIEESEAWILALLGDRRSEEHADAKKHLEQTHSLSGCEQKVLAVKEADLNALPDDAASLRMWLRRAGEVLG